MADVLILSSFVAASRVGGGAQALALARLGHEPILIPTVLLGRHPGHGPPGGGPVAAPTMEAMLQGVAAQGRFQRLGAVITGYFAHPDQIALAARVIDQIRAVNPAARIVIDPVMGDEGKGLYVAQAVAEALMGELVPRADLLAPNAWELARISGREVGDAAGALAAARSLGRPVLVSSVRAGGQIGTAYVERAGAWLASHEASPAAPNGTGDLLTVLFAAAGLAGLPAPDALHAAVSGVAEAVAAAPRAAELSVADFPSRLDASPRVSLHAIDL